MTKKELIETLQNMPSCADLSKNQIDNVLIALGPAVQTALYEEGDSVTLPGLGKFTRKWRNERSGTKPGTGERITIPGKFVVHFKAGKALNDAIND